MPSLPAELFPHVLKYLPLEPLKKCSLTNSTFHEAATPFLSRHLSLGLMEPRHFLYPRVHEKLDVVRQSPWKERISRYTEELSLGEMVLLRPRITEIFQAIGDADLIHSVNFFFDPWSERSLADIDDTVMPSLQTHIFPHIRSLTIIGVEQVSLDNILNGCPHLECLTIEPFWISHRPLALTHSTSISLRQLVLSFRSPWDGTSPGQPWQNIRTLLESVTQTISSLILGPSVFLAGVASAVIHATYPVLQTLTLRVAAEMDDGKLIPFVMIPGLQVLVIELEFRNPLNAGILFRSLHGQLRSSLGFYLNLRTLEIRALELTTKFTTQISPDMFLNKLVEETTLTMPFVFQMPYLYDEGISLDNLFYSAARCVKKWLPAWEDAGRLRIVKSQLLQAPWIFPEQTNR
ncbi:hypothetical protein DL96DRAFT_1816669 [Flagelloscypha sp. PMI_526]|nr:hypothetical protein DL96DRAFT_1816669 [Flagelloscypha sp. PMI_526]